MQSTSMSQWWRRGAWVLVAALAPACGLIAGLGDFKDAPATGGSKGTGGSATTSTGTTTTSTSETTTSSGSDAGTDAVDAPSCGDTSTSADNCGACGHSCGSGVACNDGLCAPLVLMPNQSNPTSIATDGHSIYWTNSGTTATHNSDATVLGLPDNAPTNDVFQLSLDSTTSDCQGISYGNHYVFWTFNHGGQLIQSSASQSQISRIGNTSAQHTAVSPDQSTVYWTVYDNPPSTHMKEGQVQKATIPIPDGGTGTVVVTGLTFPQGISVTNHAVCYVERGVEPNYSGTVSCQMFGSMTPTPLGPANGYGAVAADDVDVFWTSRDDGKIWHGGSIPAPILTGLTSPLEIALDQDHIYWTNDTGEVWRADRSGESPLRLAIKQSSPLGLTVDSTYVYWVNRGTKTFPSPAENPPYQAGDPDPFDESDGQVVSVAK